jgi:hypothetical protein
MDFTINGQAANITLEKEESVGEILSGIEAWLANSDHTLSGIVIDGEEMASGDISAVFSRKLDSINTIDVKTSSRLVLYFEALTAVLQYLAMYAESSFEDKKVIQKNWEESAPASFIKNREIELFSMLNDVFSGEGRNPADAKSIIEERIRELEHPSEEINYMNQLVEDCAKRLEDLPLDLQTGKDFRAAETIQFFSGISEKLFRIISILEKRGFKFENLTIENQHFQNFLEEFSTALQELLSAYESKDSVLVGDLAEYELAPRLRGLYASINDPAQCCSQEVSS